MGTFYDVMRGLKGMPFEEAWRSAGVPDVERVLRKTLRKTDPDAADFLVLLSPVASICLEAMEEAAAERRRAAFGASVALFSPLYLSDACVNVCLYCGFRADNRFPRKTLSEDEIAAEADAIRASGIRRVLAVTGDSPRASGVGYLKRAAGLLARRFDSVAVEVQALDVGDYAELAASGVDGVTVHQEVYDEQTYRSVHAKGPKRRYRYRLEAPERACTAGMRRVTVGALLGLADWRKEIFFAAMHARYLRERFPGVRVGVAFPRVRPHPGGWKAPCPVGERELVQAMLAVRLFLPDAAIVLSTRERAELRDRMVRSAATDLSAGSSTEVGGYAGERVGRVPQFEIVDRRKVEEIRAALIAAGMDPV